MDEPRPPDEILDHYQRVQDEDDRLRSGPDGTMEAIRTLELLGRHLPAPPARILDVGGGPGFYARRMTAAGYEVHLIDPVPLHVAKATLPDADLAPPASAGLGDARMLAHPDGTFDAVLLLGPLYHLTDRADRMTALGEARRVLRRGGVVAAAGISRYVSAIDGLDRGLADDPAFAELMRRDLEEGQHRNETGNPEYFTTAFFHHPGELQGELVEAGFDGVAVFAVEGISWAAPDLAERLADPDRREVVLDIVRRTESEPALLGASPHLLAIGRR